MKKLFIDTNIIIDLLAQREPFYRDAARLFSHADKKHITLYTSALSIATTYYILSQRLKFNAVKPVIRKLKLLLNTLPLDDKILDLALNDDSFSDFEDGIQYYSALENDLQIIISRNLKDFKNSKIPVMAVDQFINSIELG